ncbi:Na(+)-translocating NADH-quinone reductase subunit C [Rubripirellula lacrimiformis]|uniref:Na(+)-translocating NADH-quinone reductase subunit C n=1 Tax=Rubripirellula lacrimiformis TaxID=1930273 RepID=A0A517N8Y0_9BACT|nr:Na(+)-translocating NADH-quinone reductase subunit C [Rubripirellula lacrimiformis]QDT03600.1 Na(+)-translocating NADH-quinone reductase subunit C [Rubripirellula lacrimiformis]
MQRRDSLMSTVATAAVLCIVCSLAVSAAAVALRPTQLANEKLDQQKNILDAAGLAIGEYGVPAGKLSKKQIDELYGWVHEGLINMDDGSFNNEVNAADWELAEAASDSTAVKIVDPEYDPGEEKRPSVMKVYFVTRPGSDTIQQVVLPIYGKGLWGTLWGYMALKSDLETIQGLTFYQHKETPGLGGEVDNPAWKAKWDGRKLYDADGEPAAMVFKGPAPADNVYAVDGLSGATITSNGVTKMVRYWASDDAYGPFLAKLGKDIQDGTPILDQIKVNEETADATEAKSADIRTSGESING